MRIVTSLLHVNDKEYEMPRISANKQADFKGTFIFIHVAMDLNYQKSDVCVVNLRIFIFGQQRIKGFREKK